MHIISEQEPRDEWQVVADAPTGFWIRVLVSGDRIVRAEGGRVGKAAPLITGDQADVHAAIAKVAKEEARMRRRQLEAGA